MLRTHFERRENPVFEATMSGQKRSLFCFARVFSYKSLIGGAVSSFP
jgi:hypothetical protein